MVSQEEAHGSRNDNNDNDNSEPNDVINRGCNLLMTLRDERNYFNQWSGILADYVATTVFNKCQFLNSDGDLEFGKVLCKLCCNHLQLPEQSRFMFWQSQGAAVVRETIKRCRTSRTTAMKNCFLSKWTVIYIAW